MPSGFHFRWPTDMSRHRIKPKLLVLYEPLPWDVFDHNGMLLMSRGTRLTRESQRDILVARGLYAAEAPEPEPARTDAPPPPPTTEPLDPLRLWESVISELEILLRGVASTKNFREQIENLARLILELVGKVPDAALAAIMLADQKRYPVVHSIHTAILTELTGSRLGWTQDHRLSVICAALTQNLGMLDLQSSLCQQSTPPTALQRGEILRHPILSHELLRGAEVTDPLWLQAVLEHHEHPDGGGYPFGIQTPCAEGMLLQTADIFSAKISARTARSSITPQKAARSLYLESGNGRKNPFVAVLIKEIGIFPPGTFVKLANDEIALVMHRGSRVNTPEALSLTTPQGIPYHQPVLRHTAHRSFAIVAVIPRNHLKFRVNLERIWSMA